MAYLCFLVVAAAFATAYSDNQPSLPECSCSKLSDCIKGGMDKFASNFDKCSGSNDQYKKIAQCFSQRSAAMLAYGQCVGAAANVWTVNARRKRAAELTTQITTDVLGPFLKACMPSSNGNRFRRNDYSGKPGNSGSKHDDSNRGRGHDFGLEQCESSLKCEVKKPTEDAWKAASAKCNGTNFHHDFCVCVHTAVGDTNPNDLKCDEIMEHDHDDDHHDDNGDHHSDGQSGGKSDSSVSGASGGIAVNVATIA